MELSLQQALALGVQLAMGISLAASAGLRTFLPLLVVGAAGRAGWVPLTSYFEWMESTPALVVFGVAVVFELLADKFPGVDNLLDGLQAFVKPVAGTMLVASVLTELSPLTSVVLGIVLGGGSSGIVHLLKAKLRLVSTISTIGVANPVISTAEDAGALVGSVGAIFVPVLIFLLAVVAVVAGVLVFRRLRRGRVAPGQAVVGV